MEWNGTETPLCVRLLSFFYLRVVSEYHSVKLIWSRCQIPKCSNSESYLVMGRE